MPLSCLESALRAASEFPLPEGYERTGSPVYGGNPLNPGVQVLFRKGDGPTLMIVLRLDERMAGEPDSEGGFYNYAIEAMANRATCLIEEAADAA